ncbi:hypothetical protein EJP82_11135 [Paenibacillus anaericanus]|uniref:Uncharacterized protein n=1 Tax=Paenibacillus anaericanus TaxID=170367 RepID=A0A3S1BPW9_9BACL|nr:hypothetical protein [Paenibacillus anaericanus]RUT46776.1 hypothetical protein EJP82_11135 [Paenibacillus anaericanus]
MEQLSPEALEARRQYEREYRRKWRQKPENKKKQKEYERRYWERKAQQSKMPCCQSSESAKPSMMRM